MNLTVFDPDNKKIALWELIVLISSVYFALVIPFNLVFDLPDTPPLIALNILVTVIFGLDILYNFNLAFSRYGKLVTDRKEISKRYLGRWFWIDLLAFIPFGLIFAPLNLLNLHRLVKLLRITRLLKLVRVINTIQKEASSRMNPAILRLGVLLFWIVMVAHFITCGWLSIYPRAAGQGIGGQYLRAFYWTITTITTIGYGDITPNTNNEIVYVIIIELIGAAMYGLIIGNIANLIVNIDVAKNQFKEKVEKINTFLKYRNIPHSVQKKINDYYQYLWETRRGYEETSVLQDLPEPLKVTVSLYLNKEIIEKVPIFEGASDEFIRDIILNLQPVVYSPNDYIVRAGEMGSDMYFISKGAVEVLSPDETITYATLTAGQFFGEMALLLSIPRTATIKALDYCDLYRLHKDTFDMVLGRFPDFEEQIRRLSEKRKAENEQLKKKKK